MRKLWAVLKREYRETVRKPSFLVMTVLAPFLMAALMIVPALLAAKGMGERRVAILDGTGRLGGIVAVLERKSPEGNTPFARGGNAGRGGTPTGRIVPEYVNLFAVDPKNAVGPFLARLPGVGSARVDTNRAELRLEAGADPQELLAAAVGRLRILRFEVVAPSLEEVVLEAVGGTPAEVAA